MKVKGSKVIYVWVAIVLIAVLAVACSSNKEKETNDPKPTATNVANTDNKEGDNKEDEVKEEESIRHKISWLGQIGGYPMGDDAYAAKYLEDKFNIDFEVVRVDDEQQMNLYLSTGDTPDLFVLHGNKIKNYSENGVIAPIPLELVQQHMPNYYKMVLENDEKAFSYSTFDGKLYGLPAFNSTVSPAPIAIRADWLTNVGADIPVTLQELEGVLLKFRNDDPDKNGKKDTYGLSMGSDNSGFWFQSIFAAFGTHPFLWQKESDTKLTFGFNLPQTKDALKLLKKWYEMEIIDPEFITDKARTNGTDDTIYKFSVGRIGYLDNVTYDDHQWDNDGNLNAKWVANAPEWQEFFSNPDNTYITPAFTEIPTSGPQPVYVNIAPPIGPDGKSGSYTYGTNKSDLIVLGSEVADNEDKMIRILQILEADLSDEETYVNLQVGPEGTVWEWNDQGQRIYKKDWLESDLYHPQGRTLGTGSFFDVFFQMNPDFNSVFGGPRAEQRFELTQKLASTNIPSIINELKAPISSASKYSKELNAMLQEYILKAILGEVDIDATYDATVKKWYDNGGQEMTDEANAWFESTQ